jgi:hypothetical protein
VLGMKVELLYFDGCPHWKTADQRLRQLAAEGGFELGHRLIATPDEAREAGFRGSPTILVDGEDPFADGQEPLGLSCRVYRTPSGIEGAPTIEQLRAALGTP